MTWWGDFIQTFKSDLCSSQLATPLGATATAESMFFRPDDCKLQTSSEVTGRFFSRLSWVTPIISIRISISIRGDWALLFQGRVGSLRLYSHVHRLHKYTLLEIFTTYNGVSLIRHWYTLREPIQMAGKKREPRNMVLIFLYGKNLEKKKLRNQKKYSKVWNWFGDWKMQRMKL